MSAFYQTYRPYNFHTIIGQDSVVLALKNAILQDKVNHGYIFTGPRGVGKTTFARIFAKAINCLDFKDDLCNKCANCAAINENTLDLVEIDAASNNGVDEIRSLIEQVSLYPNQLKYKVYIIDEVHMLSKAAFNALLKTLEEPPSYAVFILATTELHKVPLTILSRVQKFDFSLYLKEDIIKQLSSICKVEKLQYSKDILELLAEHSGGGMRDALSNLSLLSSVGDNLDIDNVRKYLGFTKLQDAFDLLAATFNYDKSIIVDKMQNIAQSGIDILALINDLLDICKNILLAKINPGILNEINAVTATWIKDYDAKLSQNNCKLIIRLLLKAYKDTIDSPIIHLPLTYALFEYIDLNSSSNTPKDKLSGSVGLNQSVSSQSAKPLTNLAKDPEINSHIKSINSVADQSEPITETIIEKKDQYLENPDIAGISSIIVETQDQTKDKDIDIEQPMAAVDFATLQTVWPAFMDKVLAINPGLGSILKQSVLTGIDGNFACIDVLYKFHADMINGKKFITLFEDIFAELLNKKLHITASINKEEVSKESVIDNAMSILDIETVE